MTVYEADIRSPDGLYGDDSVPGEAIPGASAPSDFIDDITITIRVSE